VLTVTPNSHSVLSIKSASPAGSKKIKQKGRLAALFLLGGIKRMAADFGQKQSDNEL
jgi:hypothetical protein